MAIRLPSGPIYPAVCLCPTSPSPPSPSCLAHTPPPRLLRWSPGGVPPVTRLRSVRYGAACSSRASYRTPAGGGILFTARHPRRRWVHHPGRQPSTWLRSWSSFGGTLRRPRLRSRPWRQRQRPPVLSGRMPTVRWPVSPSGAHHPSVFSSVHPYWIRLTLDRLVQGWRRSCTPSVRPRTPSPTTCMHQGRGGVRHPPQGGGRLGGGPGAVGC